MTIFQKKSLRNQTALWTFLATGLLIAFVLFSYAFIAYRIFQHDYKQEIESRMEIVATSLVSMVEHTDYIGMLRHANSLLVTQGVVGVIIVDANGHPLIQKGSSQGFLLQHRIGHKGELIGVIKVTFSDTPIKDKIKALILWGGIIALVGVPVTAILIWFVSGRQLKDLQKLALEVQKIGDIESENIALTGMDRHDEIGYLTRALAERNDSIRESKKLEQLLYSAINQSHDSVVITDADAKIEYVNPAFSRITGYSYEEVIGQNPRILQSGRHSAKFYQIIWKNLSGKKTWKGLIVNKRKNGEEYQEEATITPVVDSKGRIHHYVAMKRDVSQEVVLERKLARAEKMQAIGLMASGVAHDLNNILSGIVGYPELLLLRLPKDSNLRKPIETIQESGQRAAAVVSDLLTVAKGAAAAREGHDLNALVRQYLDSPEFHRLKSLYPKVTVRQQLDANRANILCSSVHIKKCLMNLVLNAAEAIIDDGTIRISTQNQQIVKTDSLVGALKEGDYVVLNVQDTGTGISDSDLEHVFEPFYTRKVMGRSGSGLGLTVVWNTVQDHNGHIHVKSSGEGSCFQLYFPVTSEQADIKVDAGEMKCHTSKGEHILVVDDEALLCDITSEMLHTLGYKVDSVPSGESAISFIEENPVDLMVIDMLMGSGMNGRQTYEAALKLYPDQKAIISSGFSESADIKAALRLGASGFIKKPFSIDQLDQMIQAALSG